MSLDGPGEGPGEDGLEGPEIAGAHTWQLLYAQ